MYWTLPLYVWLPVSLLHGASTWWIGITPLSLFLLIHLVMAPEVGIEPTTTRLTAERSTVELFGNMVGKARLELAFTLSGLAVYKTVALTIELLPNRVDTTSITLGNVPSKNYIQWSLSYNNNLFLTVSSTIRKPHSLMAFFIFISSPTTICSVSFLIRSVFPRRLRE